MRTAAAARRRAPVLLTQWLLLSAALLALVAWSAHERLLARVDHWVQDVALRLVSDAPHPDIALITIDDRSVASIGRWPWRRALHAQLVRQISAHGPRAIGLDILLGEADDDYPGDDLLLGQALAASERVVLPVARRGLADAADAPLALLRQNAHTLGHVQLAVDADGVARSYFEREGPAGAPWPTFARALRCAAGELPTGCAASTGAPAQGSWEREGRRAIVFARGQTPFVRHSYVDLLTGRVPEGALRGKYVLVGATAIGLGDMFAAPLAAPSQRIPGVEMLAQTLHSELSGRAIGAAPPAWNLAFNLAPVLLALLAMLLAGPLAGLLACAALFALTLAATAAAPALLAWQFAPAAALAGIAAAYPLWSWRRLALAAHFLQRQMQALEREGLALAPHTRRTGDLLQRRIRAVEQASDRLHVLHQFVRSSLQQLPSPTFVCDAAARVTLANAAAEQYAGGGAPLAGLDLHELLAGLLTPQGSAVLAHDNALAQLPAQQEVADAAGRHHLMLCKPFEQQAQTHWLVTLVDLTDMRRAQAQRDRVLHFLSHDMRAPMGSIVTLLEMQRALPDPLPQDELLARVERHAQQALAMAQGFVEFVSAQAQPRAHQRFDLAHTLAQAVDDAWTSARQRGVRVLLDATPEAAPCDGEQALVARALTNLIGNAVKFSPAGAQVRCTLQAHGAHWAARVCDQGPGITHALQERLFQPFARLHQGSHPGVAGVGLGLAMVRMVAQRHGGRITVESDGKHGSCFTLELPRA